MRRFESEAFKQQMMATVKQPGKVFRNLGNVDAEFAKGGKVIEAMYYTPMAAHASMEPPAAVAEFSDGKATIWAPTQNPQAVQDAVAAALGHRQERRHLPRHAARRRLRPQVEAGLRRGSGGAVEEARQAGQGGLDARGRHPLRLLPHDGGGVSQGRRSMAAASRRRGCSDRCSRRSRPRSRLARASH